MLYFGDFEFFCLAIKPATLMYKVIEILNDGAVVDFKYNGSFWISLYIHLLSTNQFWSTWKWDWRHNALEVAQRKVGGENLQSKYEAITNVRMEQTDSSENFHMYKFIRAAQRKEELQIEGDELNRKIKVKEKEHFALQTFLERSNC